VLVEFQGGLRKSLVAKTIIERDALVAEVEAERKTQLAAAKNRMVSAAPRDARLLLMALSQFQRHTSPTRLMGYRGLPRYT
jgi:hypothetical protein